MAYPASILLLYLNLYKGFKYFTNLIAGRQFIQSLYKFKLENVSIYESTFNYMLKDRVPNVFKHLRDLKIQSEVFLIEWFYTLFCRAFKFPVVTKLWDLFLYYEEVAFF